MTEAVLSECVVGVVLLEIDPRLSTSAARLLGDCADTLTNWLLAGSVTTLAVPRAVRTVAVSEAVRASANKC